MNAPLSRRGFLALAAAAAAHGATAADPLPLAPMPRIKPEPLPEPPAEPVDPSIVVQANTAFAFDLYGQLRKEPGNRFFSPFSLSTALGMTSAGAAGATRDQMTKVLHLPADLSAAHAALGALTRRANGPAEGKRAYELSVANAIWGQKGYPWRPDFTALLQKAYGAGLHPTDFAADPEAARGQINGWVEKETREKIKELLAPGILNQLTRLVLTNAVYFKADWLAKFDKANTAKQPFHLADGKEVECDLMHRKGTVQFRGHEQLQVLELPYAGKELSMVVLLPRQTVPLEKVEEALSAEQLEKWTGDMRTLEADVYLPRFKAEQSLSLKVPLTALGMVDAFDELKADFSGMHTGSEALYVTAVVHKAFVDVNEEGTEAAAASAVIVGARSVGGDPPVFRADRPFVYLIRDNRTGGVLFLGRMTDPSAKG